MTISSATLAALTLTALTASSSFAQCPTPVNYCSATPNSVGPGASISWTGTTKIADDDFHLTASGCPPNEFLLFFYGAGGTLTPFGRSALCVGGGGVGLFRFPVVKIDGSGTADLKVDYTVPPAGGDHHDPGVWNPGSTWYVQAWYRDPAAGAPFYNFSDALKIQVCAGDSTLAFSEDFDGVTSPNLPAGWTSGANGPDSGSTAWELGTPSSTGASAAKSQPNCVATNISGNYGFNTDIWLRTPSIDLTNETIATLSFHEFKYIEASGADLDFGTIRILAAFDLTELAVVETEVEGASTDWEEYSIALPSEAFTEPIIIEFRFQSDATDLLLGVQNGGFELPVLMDGEWNMVGGFGWSVIDDAAGIWNPDITEGYPGEAFEGENAGWVQSSSQGQATLAQSIGAPLTANTQFDLSCQVGNPFFNGSQTSADYRLELLAGGVLLQSQSGKSPAAGQWQAHSMSWNSGPNPPQLGQPLEVRLIAEASPGQEIDYDDVRLTAVPQGGIGFAGWYIDDVEIRTEIPDTEGSWQVLPNSPLAPYYHHDDIFFIDANVGWVCNISGEIWKTTDGGDTWTRVLHQPATSFRTITFVDALKGWAGNLGPGSWVGSTSDPNPLYATTDGGLTWTPVTNISGPLPHGICGLWTSGPNHIYGAGRYAGGAYIISSKDGGASWVSQDMNAVHNAFVDVLFLTPMEGYITASSAHGKADLLHTTDGGASWTIDMTNNAYHYWKIGAASDTFFYGVCWSGPDSNKWIQTYDGGQTWADRVFAGGFEANGIGFLDEQTGWIGGHEINTYQTKDGGDNWELIQIDTIYGDYINKFLKVSDTVMYAVGMRVYKYSPPGGAQGGPSQSGPTSPPPGFDNSLCTLDVETSNGRTIVTYKVPEDDNVQITIYERGGLVHDRLIEEHQRAGTYRVEFTAHGDTPVLYASIVTGRYRQKARFDNPPGVRASESGPAEQQREQ